MSTDIASPCCKLCRLDESTRQCEGCRRTLDEISRWSRMDDEEKLAVLAACRLRSESKPSLHDQQIPSSRGSSSSDSSMAAGVPGSNSEG